MVLIKNGDCNLISIKVIAGIYFVFVITNSVTIKKVYCLWIGFCVNRQVFFYYREAKGYVQLSLRVVSK
jgi:hypothetical protein